MSDPPSILWPAEPHTLAKHAILETYLKAWAIIMSRQSSRVAGEQKQLLFVDGFAGPGAYSTGDPGSPVLAIRAIAGHSGEFPTPVRLLFIESRKARFEHLQAVLGRMKKEITACRRIVEVAVRHGDCTDVLEDEIDRIEGEGKRLGPAFFFLDQFGYSHVPMHLISKTMQNSMCEVFSYLSWKGLNRWMSHKAKHPAIDAAYGGKQWRPALDLVGDEKRIVMLETYRSALKAKANAEFVWHFTMCDTNGKPIYWLFFCTNNLRGLEEMKRAMWKVAPSGDFRFSDRDDPAQLKLFNDYGNSSLARDLSRALKGKVCTVRDVKRFVLTETPACLFKGALRHLEQAGALEVVAPAPKRRKGQFPDEKMLVRFSKELV